VNSVKLIALPRTKGNTSRAIVKVVSGSIDMQILMQRLGPMKGRPVFEISSRLFCNDAEFFGEDGTLLGAYRFDVKRRILQKLSAKHISWEWR